MPRRCHVLIPESVNVTLCGKRHFASMIALRTLKIGNLYWIIHIGPICNYKCPYEREAVGDLTTEEEGNVTTEARCYAAGFGDGGRGHGPGNARNAAPEAGKGKGMDFPVEPPEGGWPCRYLETDFGLQRVQNCKRRNVCHQVCGNVSPATP